MKMHVVTYLTCAADDVMVSTKVFQAQEHAEKYLAGTANKLKAQFEHWNVINEFDDKFTIGNESQSEFVELEIQVSEVPIAIVV